MIYAKQVAFHPARLAPNQIHSRQGERARQEDYLFSLPPTRALPPYAIVGICTDDTFQALNRPLAPRPTNWEQVYMPLVVK